jgi:hypothetical protein
LKEDDTPHIFTFGTFAVVTYSAEVTPPLYQQVLDRMHRILVVTKNECQRRQHQRRFYYLIGMLFIILVNGYGYWHFLHI